MPRRIVAKDGERWSATASGRHTQYSKDEFSVVFTRLSEPREQRVARYSPLVTKSRESSLATLSDAELLGLLARSQPSWTSAELGYRR